MLSRMEGVAKSTAEHGATSAARAALSHSSARVSASQACSVAELSIAQITASPANWLAADTAGTPVQGAWKAQRLQLFWGAAPGALSQARGCCTPWRSTHMNHLVACSDWPK